VALLVWFWMTPIVYSAFKVQEVLAGRKILGVSLWGLYQANPLASIAMGFQRALYGVIRPVGSDQVLPEVSLAWLAGVLAIVLAASVVFLLYTWRRFFELSGDFAEEL
jgi:ABC-type polysaccharide/polyol phosphate export permease